MKTFLDSEQEVFSEGKWAHENLDDVAEADAEYLHLLLKHKDGLVADERSAIVRALVNAGETVEGEDEEDDDEEDE